MTEQSQITESLLPSSLSKIIIYFDSIAQNNHAEESFDCPNIFCKAKHKNFRGLFAHLRHNRECSLMAAAVTNLDQQEEENKIDINQMLNQLLDEEETKNSESDIESHYDLGKINYSSDGENQSVKRESIMHPM